MTVVIGLVIAIVVRVIEFVVVVVVEYHMESIRYSDYSVL